MDQYIMPTANDFEVFGHDVEGGRFDVYKIVDIDRRVCYLFNGASMLDYVGRFDNHFIQDVSLTIKDDAFLTAKSKLQYKLPSILTTPHPFVDGDNFYVRNVLATILIASQNEDDGLDNLLESERPTLNNLGLDLDI